MIRTIVLTPFIGEPSRGGGQHHGGPWSAHQFDEEIGRVLPRGEFPIIDLTPPDHAYAMTH